MICQSRLLLIKQLFRCSQGVKCLCMIVTSANTFNLFTFHQNREKCNNHATKKVVSTACLLFELSNTVIFSTFKFSATVCVHDVLPVVCCSSFAWPAPGCLVPDPAQEGYCWPGGASSWGKAETVMVGRHLT